ncbi:hypothetical protein [Dyadobacter sp. 32]|uniref:hypothetical protein n=1 Tax=Dyadobacter sp. 32 TaxID=538966 RepID=UPI0011EEC1C7
MKKILLFTIVTIVFTSCVSTGVVPIKGKYPDGPLRMKLDVPADTVWDRVIDLIADIGLNVRIVDKASGLVVSDPVSFTDKYSTEDRQGAVTDKGASIVTTRLNDENFKMVMKSVTASWNLRVKEVSPGKSTVSVLLYNIDAKGVVDDYRHKGKSTGVFEKWVLDNLYQAK